MLTDRLKRRVLAGDFLIGVLPGRASPDLVELCGVLGFDFVFIDGEHGVVDLETCQDMVRAADSASIAVLVRVPQNDPPATLPYIEMGAAGVIVPHVCEASEAENAVRAVKYAPRGVRGS